ncbi:MULTISPECIES: hypothetical protein [Haloferax]|uniref:Uncharacterized protein n=2 Tax=Haloferax TaxID=2251 RepID=A0A6G1Z0P1_9EURY|nr:MULTISPECIES: hypothetical protein [Haloferax]KAB1187458.1 hypothetical protein Hfx1149_05210 [Haloferax sp. CBA1149]MRW80110.1 hypothetical protein [Haloferax marinisediminis]
MTEIPYVAVLLLAALSGLTTLIGVTLALTLGRSERGAVAGIGFSTGIMVIISVLELIPEPATVVGVWKTSGAVALGLLFVAVADPLISHFHIVKEEGVYVSGHELLPIAQKYGRMQLFGLGLVLSVVAYLGLQLLF